MSRPKQDWPVQWHITPDGSAIKAYPKAKDHSNPQQKPPEGLKYLRYRTTRPLELSDLYALEADLAGSNARFDRVSTVPLIAGGAGLLGLVLASLVFPMLDLEGTPANALFTVSIPLLAIGLLGMLILPGLMRSRFERLHTAHGLASSTPEVLKEPEARKAVETPGTVSGPSIGHSETP
ncbi:hypothetical protein [Glycomyces paridis]|uniref:Uncharacterized protein n=1 Tax=Glycomyces paridis TaxID=2126555 RepID=A0A4S8PJ23_9ACTN|nr:hypothetical protein [Glycomyces paridis]THV30683.1 hypothetical protein E9998_04665 [Glycomyces paridis]